MTYKTKEFKLISLREMPLPESLKMCDTPIAGAQFFNQIIRQSPNFREDVEQMIVLFLNTRRRITGYQIVSTGLLDQVITHPREVFRLAIVHNCHSILLCHNHPSGEVSPSEGDIRTTKELIRAGQILKIEVVDHLIMGAGENYCSMRELGYFN